MMAERTGKEAAAAALLGAKGAFDPVLGFRFAQRTATTLRHRLPWWGMRFENQLEN